MSNAVDKLIEEKGWIYPSLSVMVIREDDLRAAIPEIESEIRLRVQREAWWHRLNFFADNSSCKYGPSAKEMAAGVAAFLKI